MRGIDHIVFSGDATALGLEAEFRRAAEILGVGDRPIPGIAVPGNHDYLTRATAASGLFERYFAAWQEGVRIAEHRYPFAQRAGPVWLVGVNAATGNWMPMDASGAVGPVQCERLRQLLAALDPGPRVLVIHYPIRLSSGASEHRYHGLRDLDEVLAVAKAGGVCLWLHGHRHEPYFFDTPTWAPFPTVCAGSGTQGGIWSYNEYTVDATGLRATRRVFDPDARQFRDVQTFAPALRRPAVMERRCRVGGVFGAHLFGRRWAPKTPPTLHVSGGRDPEGSKTRPGACPFFLRSRSCSAPASAEWSSPRRRGCARTPPRPSSPRSNRSP